MKYENRRSVIFFHTPLWNKPFFLCTFHFTVTTESFLWAKLSLFSTDLFLDITVSMTYISLSLNYYKRYCNICKQTLRKHVARNFNPEHNILEYFDMLHFFLSPQVKRSVIIINKNRFFLHIWIHFRRWGGLGAHTRKKKKKRLSSLAWLTLRRTNWKQRSQLSTACTGQHQNKIPRKVADLRKISKIYNHSSLPILPPEIHTYSILTRNY